MRHVVVAACLLFAVSAQPVQFGPTTNANGESVRGCFSSTSGFHAHDEVWISLNGDWQRKCVNGTDTVIGCVASRRANYAVIPVGETLDVNGFWHKCEYINATQNVRYTEEPSCFMLGRELKINDTMRQGSFEVRCTGNADAMIEIVGCYYYSTSGQAKLLMTGEEASDDMFLHTCKKLDNGRVEYRYVATKCRHNGTTYEVGDVWQHNRFRMQCKEKGAYEIIGCTSEDGVDIEVGSHRVVNNSQVQRCYRVGRQVAYQSYPCGSNGRSCEVEPLGETSGVDAGTNSVQDPAPGTPVQTVGNAQSRGRAGGSGNGNGNDADAMGGRETPAVVSLPPNAFTALGGGAVLHQMSRTTVTCTPAA